VHVIRTNKTKQKEMEMCDSQIMRRRKGQL
jgi:hypothetical protein